MSIIFQRVPDVCVTPWWMKMAYYDHACQECVMVAWPLNYIVTLAWMANLAWSRFRHQPSWIDKQIDRREQKGVDPRTGKAWLTPRMERNAIRTAEAWANTEISGGGAYSTERKDPK